MEVVDDGKSVDGKESKVLLLEVVDDGDDFLSLSETIGIKETRD